MAALGLDGKTCGDHSSPGRFVEVIKRAKLVVWNGPMGVFEFDNFANGTKG